MRVVRFLLNAENSLADHIHVREIKALPRLSRLAHPKMRRHLFAVALGASLCCVGSFLSTHPEVVHNQVPHWAWDAFAYTVHGIGLGPILAHVEPIWKYLLR